MTAGPTGATAQGDRGQCADGGDTRPTGGTPAATPVELAPNLPDVGLRDLQAKIRATYGDKDRARGVDATLGWFFEEAGELSRAIRRQGHAERVVEFSDVLAWLVTLADLSGIDLATAMARYEDGCPRCATLPCTCA